MSLPETTLSSPLLEASYKYFFDELGAQTQNLKTETGRLVRALIQVVGGPTSETSIRHTPEMTPRLSTLGSCGRVPIEVAESLLQDSSRFLTGYLAALTSGIKEELGLDISGIQNLQTNLSVSPRLLTSFRDMLYWTNVVELAVDAATTSTWNLIAQTLVCRRFVAINDQGKWIILTYDAALMFKDMMYSRFLVECLSAMDPSRSGLSPNLEAFVLWGNRVLLQHGNEGYELIKGVEALAKVRMVDMVEKWLDSASQAREMVDKYKLKEQALGGGCLVQELWNFLVSIPAIEQQAEVFGFLKLMGHPYVNPRTGCRKVQSIVHTPDKMEFEACEALGHSFCHLYTKGYLAIKGEWPPLEFTPRPGGVPTRLEELCRKSHPTLAFGFTQYDQSDWEWATFLPHISYDMGADILDLMSDKALSNPRSEFDAPWYGKLDYNPPRATGSKRVLEQLLVKDKLNMEEVVRRVQSGDIPFDWKIVSVSPKEREMKLDPRMFAKMVLEMRSFFVLSEKNLKEGVFKYINEQTMTLNRQELLARFLTLTKPNSDRWVRLTVEIDYSSWNLHFSSQNNDPVGNRLNQIYGQEGIYTTAHNFFDECLVVMDNGDYPPEGLTAETREQVLNGEMYLDTVWSEHDRGFEGITQGVWTVSTTALGHQAVQDMGIPFIQSGQGDNQVYTFSIYIPDGVERCDISTYVRGLEKEILTRLNYTAAQVGHEIKPEECICSTSFFSYGKEIYVDGVYVPSLPKFVSRIFPTTTSDSPSTYEMIATVASGGTAATEKSNISIPCLSLCKFIESLTIRRSVNRSMLHKGLLRDELQLLSGGDEKVEQVVLDLLCTIPGNLGGLPISSPLEFLYRGHSDPVASSLTGLLFLQNIPGVREYLTCLEKGWFFKPEPQPQGLILDPYSLPFDTPSPPSTAVSAEVTPVLLQVVKNQDLVELKLVASEEVRAALFTWLGSVTPFYPKVSHDLYKCSPVGVLDGLTKRFTNTRTLVNLTKQAGTNLARVSINADLNYLRSTIRRVMKVFKVGKAISDIHSPSNSYEVIRKLRRSWGLGDLEGVTNLHPLSSGRILSLPDGHRELCGSGEVVCMSPITNSDSCHSTRGPYTPFLGNKTEDKMVGKWVRPVDSSPPLRDVLKILMIQEMMTIPGSRLWLALDTLAQSRTTVSLDLLRNFLRTRFGGTNAHRYRTRDDPKGSFVNISTNWPTNLVVSTNHAGDLGQTDYPFDFTEAVTCLQGLMAWWCFKCPREAPFGLVLQVDVQRMSPVSDHIIDSALNGILEFPVAHSYYLMATKVIVSSNTKSSAKFVQNDILSSLPHSEGDVDAALINLLLSHLSGRIPVSSKFGHTLGEPSYRRIVDLPELRKLTYGRFCSCLSTAIRLKVSYGAALLSVAKPSRCKQILTKMVNTEVRRSIPSLYGSFRELIYPQDSPIPGVGLGQPEAIRALPAFMTVIRDQAISYDNPIDVQVFLRGSSSISKALTALIGNEAVNLLSSDARQGVTVAKELIYVARSILSTQADEITRVRMLLALARASGILHRISICNSSPEESMRSLRLSDESLPGAQALRSYRFALPLFSLEPMGVGMSNKLDYQLPRVAPEELALSLWERSSTRLEPAMRWSPITSVVNHSVKEVLILGIGDGRMVPALHPDWRITGVDLGTVLARQGQGMVDYRPPFCPESFKLHPVSWVHGGDITNPTVLDILFEECSLGAYDLVLIDVDGVPTEERLACRMHLAQSGVPTFCKVFVEPEESDKLINSFCSYREDGDVLWETPTYTDREYILGGSAAPMGIFGSTSFSVRRHPDKVQRDEVTVTMDEMTSIQEFYLDLLGDFHTNDGSLHVRDCRSLWSYMDGNWSTEIELITVLLRNHAPRRRVKALTELLKSGGVKL